MLDLEPVLELMLTENESNKDQPKYIHIVFNWKVKDCKLPVPEESRMTFKVKATGYWQGIMDVKNFKLYSIEIIDNPQDLMNYLFKSDLYTIPEISVSHACEFEYPCESDQSRQEEDHIINICIISR